MHSKSPNLFNSFADVNELNSHYTRIFANDRIEIIKLFDKLDLNGANITAPFKSDIFEIVNKVSENAGVLENANIILNEDGHYKAYNSDVEGVFNSLLKYKHKIKSALVLGGGDSAKAAVYALRIFGIKRLAIYNRSIEKAYEIASEFQVQVCDEKYLGVISKEADLIISTISPNALAFEALYPKQEAVLFDAIYHNSKLEGIAKQRGMDFIGGDEWLINQAIPSYKLFEGITPDISDFNINYKNSKIICLIGFMGSGKTTIGRAIANKTGKHFIDLDELIEKSLNIKINDLFFEKGEENFRNLELDFLESINIENTVLACGGGTIELFASRKKLSEKFFNIYLFNTFDDVYERILDSNRPLFQQLSQIELYELYLHRLDLYFEVSDYIIHNKNIEKTTEILVKEIENNL